jgi:hypothetical protein
VDVHVEGGPRAFVAAAPKGSDGSIAGAAHAQLDRGRIVVAPEVHNRKYRQATAIKLQRCVVAIVDNSKCDPVVVFGGVNVYATAEAFATARLLQYNARTKVIYIVCLSFKIQSVGTRFAEKLRAQRRL